MTLTSRVSNNSIFLIPLPVVVSGIVGIALEVSNGTELQQK